jgi:hypothetical protein
VVGNRPKIGTEKEIRNATLASWRDSPVLLDPPVSVLIEVLSSAETRVLSLTSALVVAPLSEDFRLPLPTSVLVLALISEFPDVELPWRESLLLRLPAELVVVLLSILRDMADQVL